jgi:Tol biopolymer transport system component
MHGVNTFDRIHYRIPLGVDTYGLWLVPPFKNQKPNWILQGNYIELSPDGKTIAYSTDEMLGDTWFYDLKLHQKKLAIRKATKLVWSPDGSKVGFVRIEDKESFAHPVEIRSYPGLEFIRKLPSAVTPRQLIFSPDGSELALEHHLSRPLTGHEIVSLKTGEVRWPVQPDRFAPAQVSDWSSDGKWIASSWRLMNPNNDGSWKTSFIGLSCSDGSKYRQLGFGYDARFTSDGKYVLFLTDHRTGGYWHKSDLVIQSSHGGAIKTLAKNVTAFAVWRPWFTKLQK